MKISWVVVVGVALGAAGWAAEPAESDHVEKLGASLAKWAKARDACGGNYAYEVSWSSAFGFGHRTTITVKGNKVVERRFEEFGRPKPRKPGEEAEPAKPKWVETGKDLGRHKEGAPVRTVDELYAAAKKVVEAKVPEHHKRHLGFDKQGLLSYCYTRDTRIADDAPMSGVPPFQVRLKAKK